MAKLENIWMNKKVVGGKIVIEIRLGWDNERFHAILTKGEDAESVLEGLIEMVNLVHRERRDDLI